MKNPAKTSVARCCVLTTALLLLPTMSAYSQTDVFLKIYTKTFQRMEVDLYPFQSDKQGKDAERLSELITEVLSNDLWMSGFFKVNLQQGTPDFAAALSSAGVDGKSSSIAAITGRFKMSRNAVLIQPHLRDRTSGKTIIQESYQDHPASTRYIVHKMANDIVYNLTGERGIANSKLAYVTQKDDEIKEISIVDYDGFYAKVITKDRSLDLSPAWSPDGDKICYTSYKDGNPNLYLLDLRTQSQTILSNMQGLNSAPDWSPDGSKIALTLTKDGNAEIYVLELRKNKLRRLTFNRAIDSSPSWSPSGREIAFSSDRSGSPQIYIMDADGVDVRRLTYEGNYNTAPAWSPRGDKIAYVARTDSGLDIFTLDVTGENVMRLTMYSGNNEDPSWSPNGFALTFSSTRTGNKALYTMFWDGSDQKRITGSGNNYLPAWSPRIKF
ncbi:MAG: Tol-Pal system beta propeller repeat protein TolB [bacterium]